jgi:hypothetical protein
MNMTETVIKTKNVSLIASVIKLLESGIITDLSVPANRYKMSTLLCHVGEGMGYGDSVLSKWIRKKGFELEIEPLDEGHPQSQGEIEEYKAKIQEIIGFLKSTLPDGYIHPEEDE